MRFVRCVWLVWCVGLTPVAAYDRQSEITPAAAQAGAGQAVYAERKCATCHQIAGRGNRRFPLDGVGRRLSPDDLRRWLTDPGAMERAKDRQPAIRMSEWIETTRRLRPAEVDALVAYLVTLQ